MARFIPVALVSFALLAAAAPQSEQEKNKALVRRYLAQVVSKGDMALADALVAPGIVFTSPYTPEPTRDRESFKKMIAGLNAAFSEFKVEESAVVAEGDLVASRWTASGVHTKGPFGPGQLPPSGKRFHISGMSIYRVKDGKIVEGWVNDDTLAMMMQLGAIPPPPPVKP